MNDNLTMILKLLKYCFLIDQECIWSPSLAKLS